jgi:hypothetical protein
VDKEKITIEQVTSAVNRANKIPFPKMKQALWASFLLAEA